MDDVPTIWRSVVPWLATLTALGEIPPDRIYLHHVCNLPMWLTSLCERLGVNVRPVEPFGGDNPFCNKIRQCATDFGPSEIVALTDVDVAFARPMPLDAVAGSIAGKPVDRANPPLEVLLSVFDRAGIVPSQTCRNAFGDGDEQTTFETVLGNFNGGLYLVPRKDMAVLGEAWSRWAHWLAEHRSLLGDWGSYRDQVAFCMSVNEHRLPMQALDDRWNFPTHLCASPLRDEPFALHHHAALDDDLNLAPVADPQALPAIERANRAIQEFRRRHFA